MRAQTNYLWNQPVHIADDCGVPPCGGDGGCQPIFEGPGRRKGVKLWMADCFVRGFPRGRSVDCRPRRAAVLVCQVLEPSAAQ